MSVERFDLIAIGGGSAARDAARKAKDEFGARVALVESTRWGGDCPNVACRPTKAYVVAADLLHDIETLAERIGIEVGPAQANLARVKARKNAIRATQEQWVERLRGAGFSTYDGVASFIDPQTLQVGDTELTADKILIATGSLTAIPPIEGLAEVGFVDHVTALELEEVPESLLVLGGGPVGLEFAQIFARFGSRVTLVQTAERISPRSDADAAAEVAKALRDDGIELLTSTTATRFARDGADILASLDPAGERRVAQVLVATGRKPDLERLDLGRAGVAYERRGIVVDEHLRTTAPGIWAAGDVATRYQFTPIAQYEARLAVQDMFTDDAPVTDYSALPTAIFTDPELASVGLTEEAARDERLDFGTATHPLTSVTRAQYFDAKHGLYKLVFERGSGRVLGIHVVCRGASDVVQGLAPALRLGVTVRDLASIHHTYPSFGEGVKAAAERALTQM
jgi:pyruvate/2-oxoglutarate dehydrogenase complex dihydrolipoamide dehydrogenase (E3) component